MRNGIAISKRAIRESKPRVILEQGSKQVRESPVGPWAKRIPGRRESQCKGPEANTSLVGWKE